MYYIYKSVGKIEQSDVPDHTVAEDGSLLNANVGDRLIAEAAREIVVEETDADDVPIFWNEQSVVDNIDEINQSRALIMPGFSVQPYINYPTLARALANGMFDVPIVPMGIAWKDFPGDYKQIARPEYPDYPSEVLEFYRRVATQVDVLACREYYTETAMRQMGFAHTEMVGDCGWYDLDALGDEMRVPEQIDRIVFTDPHQSQYTDQAKRLLEMLTDLFPNAERYCSFHDFLRPTDELIRERAEELGFEILRFGNDTENLEFYDECDLHVGYRCHGHISFLRKRIPSVLLNEDGRGMGFSYSLGAGGFKAYDRTVAPGTGKLEAALRTFPGGVGRHLKRSYVDGREGSTRHPIFPADPTVVDEIELFLQQELQNGWRRLRNIPHVIDSTYEHSMKPFISTLP